MAIALNKKYPAVLSRAFNIENTGMYCVSKKYWPILWGKLLYKMGQNFLDGRGIKYQGLSVHHHSPSPITISFGVLSPNLEAELETGTNEIINKALWR